MSNKEFRMTKSRIFLLRSKFLVRQSALQALEAKPFALLCDMVAVRLHLSTRGAVRVEQRVGVIQVQEPYFGSFRGRQLG